MKKRHAYSGIGLLLLTGAITAFTLLNKSDQTFQFETTRIGKGSISNTITATGTLEAIKTVEVGTQVSGVIERILVDFNSRVKKGQLLAQIDETPLLAQLEQSKATVDQAEAQVKYQRATFDRYKVLVDKKLIAQSDFDLAEYNYNNACAALKNARSVNEKNRINLAYARIYSPIDGVILNRAVDEGQTVAASFNTPTLFAIANDLTQMRVEAKVDEADIGLVRVNQRVVFTVDAYPDLKFSGYVSEIRMQPVVSSNVVTYTVIIQAPNPETKLMPGMTASTTIFVSEKKDIQVIPGKALRFTPEQSVYAAYLKSLPSGAAPRMPAQVVPAADPKSSAVWVRQGPELVQKEVTLGDNDGINYEILSGISPDEEVVLAMTAVKATSQVKKTAKSPFLPQRPGPGK